jgi:hypothetical protein
MFAALPPHTGFGFHPEAEPQDEVKKYICTGKPKAYRSVRRRSRISLVPNGWAGFTRVSLLRTQIICIALEGSLLSG